MHNLVFMHIRYSFQDLPCDNGSALFAKYAFLIKDIIKMAVKSELNKKIDIISIIEEIIQFN
jgi:hypothetical protein